MFISIVEEMISARKHQKYTKWHRQMGLKSLDRNPTPLKRCLDETKPHTNRLCSITYLLRTVHYILYV